MIIHNKIMKGFSQLIDMYYKHNNEVLSEYNNPIESFNKVIAGMHFNKNSYSHFRDTVLNGTMT